MKKFFSSVLILIAIAFVVVGISVGVMIIFPNVSIFGYYFTSERIEQKRYEVSYGHLSFTDVVIETNGFDIYIVEATDNGAVPLVEFESLSIGLVKKNAENELIKTSSVTSQISGGVLTISTTETSGIIFRSSSYLKLYLPENVVSLNNLQIKTSGGSIYVNSLTTDLEVLDEMVVENSSKTATIDITDCNPKSSLSITNVGGKFVDFEKDISTTDVTIKSDYCAFDFYKINNLFVQEGKMPEINVEIVNGNLDYEASAGLVYINIVYGSTGVDSNSVELHFTNLLGTINIECSSSDVYVGTIGQNNPLLYLLSTATWSIKTGTGDIDINNIFYPSMHVETTRGNINIGGTYTVNNETKNGSAKSNVELVSTRGNITVYMNTDSRFDIDVLTDSGTVNVFNANPDESLRIEVTDNGYINVTYFNVHGTNEIIGKTKKVSVVVPSDSTIFDLQTSTKSGSFNVSLTNGIEYNKTSFTNEELDYYLGLASSWTDESGIHHIKSKINSNLLAEGAEITNHITIITSSGQIVVEEDFD